MLLTKIVGILLGVALGLVLSDQSENGDVDDAPIELRRSGARKGDVETPEVVLQLKYDRGELNRIYLAQFRKGKTGFVPSVSARNDLCADLCHAGLGGKACGPSCDELMAVGLKTALDNASNTEVSFGQPRVEVCPALCQNMLGQPLCNCGSETEECENISWGDICEAFCADGYMLRGCPTCESTRVLSKMSANRMTRVLNTQEGWAAWCNVQCRQGQGGAACNCDRSPV